MNRLPWRATRCQTAERTAILRTVKRHLAGSAAAICGVVSIGMPAAALAQDSAAGDDNTLAEIVVTAQRRSQQLQDVPIAITALNDEAIQRSDLSTVSSLNGQVPSLNITSGAERTNISIRGIGSNITNIAAEAGVPVNIDGVYMTRVTLSGATYGDLSQIEVLRGPQGTLYGRNATGGAVNIWTKVPDGTYTGDVSVLAGNGGRFRARGAVGLPIDGDRLSARVGIDVETLDGYRKNLYLGEKADPEDHLSGRAAVRWAPTENFTAILRASVSDDEVAGPIIQYGGVLSPSGPNPIRSGGVVAVDPTHVNADQRTRSEYRDQVYSATLTWDLDGAELKSVSAFQRHKFDSVQDADGTSANYVVVNFLENSPAFTQEVTLSGDTSSFNWIVGGWYMDDEANADLDFKLTGPRLPSILISYNQKTKAYAGFGQLTYNILDTLRATAGLRYSDETKHLTLTKNFPPPACTNRQDKNSYNDLSPKFGLDYDVTSNFLLYASATKGFKAGGANLSVCGNVYDQETLWSYESGIKTQWLNNHLRLNLNGYYYDYKDYQASTLAGDGSPTLVTRNAASATVKGLELELTALPTQGLSVDLAATYADARFDDFISPLQIAPSGSTTTINLAGNRLPASPKFSGNVAVQYDMDISPGVLSLRGEHRWSGSFYFDQYNSPFVKQRSYGMSNVRVGFAFEQGPLEGMEVSAFVHNLEDKQVLNRSEFSSLFGGIRNDYQRPRTFGTELRYQF